ncbi:MULTISPECIES: hypothetical protein [unclassified Gordonia (in: high G+C Gram-positive bacteria)]|uniref:hypothetical protein n=1 Tax=unclassified Gordonia (in: high G+C Gram-positive bacteria) TaxID=2657482 RepID=UPI000990CE20|nr:MULTISPECIES: hypothetical protein [unclassified Gordonia (in: high G+C Gram-positive bacteria)]MCX2756601.1 hypothetical protein [Gordonia sp. 4N]
MSDNDSTPEEPLYGKQPLYTDLQLTADWFAAPDIHLQGFAALANRARAGFGITLFTAAGTIAGTVIAAEDFFFALAELQREGTQDIEDEGLRKVAESMTRTNFEFPAERMREARENDDESDDAAIINQEQLTSFIHLQDAVIFHGPTRHDVGFMRVQLSHVVAWTLGGPPRD